jgi:DNA polymerase-3 subunit delta
VLKCIRGSIVLNYTEFKNGLESGQSFSVYLFEGEDSYFRERGMNLLKKKFVSEPDLNFVTLDGGVSVGELISSVEGFPFMSEKRMTVVREFYPKQDYLKSGLKDYLNNPSSSSILVILNEKPTENIKKFESVCVVDCKKADTALLIKWIKAECSSLSVAIDGETAKVLSEYCLSDMTRIQTETHKLCAYVGDGGTITKKDVDDMVSRDYEYKIYEMTDYIAKKKFDNALCVIKDMMAKGETSQRILVAVYNYFRKLLHAAISDMPLSEMATAFGVKEFAARKTKEQAAMFKKRALKSAVDALTEADYAIKSGKIDADESMYLTIFKIMTDK